MWLGIRAYHFFVGGDFLALGPDATKTLLLGEDYQERPVAPPAAPSADGANPEAKAKEPGYEF